MNSYSSISWDKIFQLLITREKKNEAQKVTSVYLKPTDRRFDNEMTG